MSQTVDLNAMGLELERGLTANETAEILGIAEITLRLWRQRAEGPPFYRVGRRYVRYRLGDVLDWRKKQTVGR